MPVPNIEAWQSRWRTPERARLGVYPEGIGDGVATFRVALPYGDARDHDPLYVSAALIYAADVAALSAALAHLDEEREQPNGTASLHLNFPQSPSLGDLVVRAEMLTWGQLDTLVEVSGRDSVNQLVLQGLVTYSLRAKTEGDRA